MPFPGSGLGSALMYAGETTWSTAVTPDHSLEFDSESLTAIKNTNQGLGLRQSADFARSARHRITERGAMGGWTMDFPANKAGMLLKHAIGSATAPTQIATSGAYQTYFTWGTNVGLGLTVQTLLANVQGNQQSFTYPGYKINDIEFSCSTGNNLKVTVNGVAYKEDTAYAAATPAYVSTNSIFSFLDVPASGGFTLGGTAATASGIISVTSGTTPVSQIRSWSLKLSRPMKDDRRGLGSAGYISEPIENAFPTITGTLETEFYSRAELYDLYTADTALPMAVKFVNPFQIGVGGQFPTISFVVPAIKFDTSALNAGGPDVIGQTINYVGLSDGTNAGVQIGTISSDTAL